MLQKGKSHFYDTAMIIKGRITLKGRLGKNMIDKSE